MSTANKRIILTNEDDDVKVSVTERGTKGVLAVEMVDSSGNQIDLISAPGTPTLYNVTMTSADTEYSKALPTGTKKVDIKLRSFNALLKIAFTSGLSGTTYIQVPYGASFHLENVNLSGVTAYFQSPTASQTCEILCWT